jgi:hypothetical protein
MGVTPHYTKPDNTALARRMLPKTGKNGEAPGALGEYLSDVYYRTYMVKGSAGQGGVMGPLSAPVIEGQQLEDPTSLLRQIRDLLLYSPQYLSNEWRTRFIMQPRETISFVSPSPTVSIAAGTAAAVVTETIDERFSGFLTHVGVNVVAPGSFPDITWQIRINGAIHPKFANRIFAANTVPTPLPFAFELPQSRTVQLVAINTSAGIIAVQGILLGWTEFLSSFKMYGSSSQSGIA